METSLLTESPLTFAFIGVIRGSSSRPVRIATRAQLHAEEDDLRAIRQGIPIVKRLAACGTRENLRRHDVVLFALRKLSGRMMKP